MKGSWDVPSAALGCLLAATGLVFAAVAAKACNSSATAAHYFLLLSGVCTIQLLVVTICCYAYRHWMVNRVELPRHQQGPSAQESTRVRRGLPALASASGKAGLDKWSLAVLCMVLVPVLVPALVWHKPSETWRFASTSKGQAIGIACASTKDASIQNGAPRYTTGAFEAVKLSMQTVVPGKLQPFDLPNTASVAFDTKANKVYAPSHVDLACTKREVAAKGVLAMVATYNCTSDTKKQEACRGIQDGKGFACVTISNFNATAAGTGPQQRMVATHSDLRVTCDVVYSMATVDVTWRGDNSDFGVDGRGRNCRITDLKASSETLMKRQDWEAIPNSEDLLGNDALQMLSLPLVNAFMHTVSHQAVVNLGYPAIWEDFYGSIFAAASMIRASGTRFDPTKTDKAVDVRYVKQACQQYGFSGLVIFLLVANVLLLICCIVLSSGKDMSRLAGAAAGGVGTARGAGGTRTPAPAPASVETSATSIPGSQASKQTTSANGAAVNAAAVGP